MLALLAAIDPLPGWIDWVSRGGLVVGALVVVWLIMSGKLRPEREVLEARAESKAWKHIAEVAEHRADAAESAARHIIESGDLQVSLVNALSQVAGMVHRGGK